MFEFQNIFEEFGMVNMFIE